MNNPGPIRRTASLLLEGWGYNLYRDENRIRADDLLIRSKVGDILAQARASLRVLEMDYRRIYLPAPTRDNPFANPAHAEQARLIGRCDILIEQAATAIASAPVPADDGVWRRHRSERDILGQLLVIDARMVDAAVGFHDLMVVLDVVGIARENLEIDVQTCLKPLRLVIQERAEHLTIMV